ncbi:PQ loop repeat-domain-containing protein [Lentinula guzmanii]|uniref:PQ loop repeat-domain-containing protein n=1 Tax=Lentinula guzmanii TaxID=2804957 RepID=A0AA38JH26_9AGAR|nr:PQ loop repeat-domain-containing protein [Lentinula guzmanii]
MPVNSVAENVFGTTGTVCWTIQLVPQLWKSYREKDTTGLSDWMILAWGVAGAFLGTYSIVKNLNIPLILQPQLFSVLTMASWAQCQYYGRKRPLRVTLLLFFCGCVILGGFEVGTIYALRPSFNRGDRSGTEGTEFFGIMSTVLIAISFIPQYYEIYKRREVIGISIWFMTVDLLGKCCVFSDLSLVFKSGVFDIVPAVTYSLVVVMDGAVILAAWILNPRARRLRLQRQEPEVSESSINRSTTGMVQTERVPAPIDSESPSETAATSPRSSCLLEKV